MDYAFCLDKGFDLEFLISLENELLDCSDDPNGNKRRLMFKFRLLYAGCVQNRCKNCPGHNVKEAQEAQRRCEAMSNNHMAGIRKQLCVGVTNHKARHIAALNRPGAGGNSNCCYILNIYKGK